MLLSSVGQAPRLLKACYWGMNLEVPQKANVELVGAYEPTQFGFNKARKGVRPEEHELSETQCG